MQARQYYSAEMVRNLPDDGNRYEVVDADANGIEVWTPDAHFPRVESKAVSRMTPGASTPLEFDLAAVFRP